MFKSIVVVVTLAGGVAHAQRAEQLDAIQVVGHHEDQSLLDFVPSVTTLRDEELRKRLHTTLGDTLQHEAGVTSTQFGPNASRPVIRGLDGPRIRVLQNSLSLLDASTQSVDHAIPIEPLLIDQVEIVRGPMALLYGASAVGGVVNIVTNRVHTQYEEGLVSEILTQGETVNSGLSNSARLDYGINRWMLHLDGSTKNLQDQQIPRYARSGARRQEEPLPAGEEEARDRLPNSGNRQDSLGAGVTRFFDGGFLGLSFSHIRNTYGTVVEEDVQISLKQNRFELIGEIDTHGEIFHKLRLRSAQSDYHHTEGEHQHHHLHFNNHDEEGTRFHNRGNETRLEALNRQGNLKGISGIQTQIFDFGAEGQEAYLPETKNRIYSIFTFQDYTVGANTLTAGARLEQTGIESEARDFSFTSYNLSAGYLRRLDQRNSASLNYSYTERAPNFQELLSDGEHMATGTFDLGDDNLRKEKAHSVELSFKNKSATSQMGLNFYAQYFKDYIALNPTGQTRGTLDEFRYEQVDALFYGIDFDRRQQLWQNEYGVVNLLSRFDFVRARNLDDNENLPRIAPPRVLLGLEYLKGRWHTDIEAQYVSHQTKTAPEERYTRDYTLVNLGAKYTIPGERTKFDLFFRLRNLFDVEARNHVSFLKEIAPLPGRNFILGGQFLF
jgi:iron complex outermembrane recepter protein